MSYIPIPTRTDGIDVNSAADINQLNDNIVNTVTNYTAADSLLQASILLEQAKGKVFHIQDNKASGTEGGACSATTWNIRTLNTVITNEITGASLDGGYQKFTLPAGTYELEISAPAYLTGRHKLRLFNVTDNSVFCYGTSEYSLNTASADSTKAFLKRKITLVSTTEFRVDHYTEVSKTVNGMGVRTSDGSTETYTTVYIRTA